VLGDVPREERCRCREGAERQPQDPRSLLERLLGS
jgi:hypothetical protein